MNKWNKNQIIDEPLIESCDHCNKLIFNWNTLGNSFVTVNGKIVCENCKKDIDATETSVSLSLS